MVLNGSRVTNAWRNLHCKKCETCENNKVIKDPMYVDSNGKLRTGIFVSNNIPFQLTKEDKKLKKTVVGAEV